MSTIQKLIDVLVDTNVSSTYGVFTSDLIEEHARLQAIAEAAEDMAKIIIANKEYQELARTIRCTKERLIQILWTSDDEEVITAYEKAKAGEQ